jgi:hypothetical protein
VERISGGAASAARKLPSAAGSNATATAFLVVLVGLEPAATDETTKKHEEES